MCQNRESHDKIVTLDRSGLNFFPHLILKTQEFKNVIILYTLFLLSIKPTSILRMKLILKIRIFKAYKKTLIKIVPSWVTAAVHEVQQSIQNI